MSSLEASDTDIKRGVVRRDIDNYVLPEKFYSCAASAAAQQFILNRMVKIDEVLGFEQ